MKQRGSAVIFLLCMYLVGFWSVGASQVSEALMRQPFIGNLPIDKDIGQLVPHTFNDASRSATAAFTSEFGPEWYDMYVEASVRFPFSRVHDTFLSTKLPFKAVMVGQSITRGTAVSIPMKVLDQDGSYYRFDVVLEKNSDERWVLVALGEVVLLEKSDGSADD
jgi:hypothetical protein